jgi:hypothetical protein
LSNDTNGDGETFDISEFKARIKRAREALTEFEDFMTTWEEAESRKKNATETEFQE